MASPTEETLLEFPCRFPIKVMGRQNTGFEKTVMSIIGKHAELWPDEPIRRNPSSAGKFVSVTAVVTATSKKQLDSIYQELTDCDEVLMSL